MDNNQPIGIFDSGIGGTSIWKEIHHLLPMKTIYLADSMRLMAKNLKKRL
jgi:glutamate racemase